MRMTVGEGYRMVCNRWQQINEKNYHGNRDNYRFGVMCWSAGTACSGNSDCLQAPGKRRGTTRHAEIVIDYSFLSNRNRLN